MKHRTVTVFIVVLAALAAVPQTFEQLSSLKNAAGNRLTAGVWSVFLGLHGQKVEGGSRSQQLPQTARLVRASAPEGHAPAQVAKREARPSRSFETATGRAVAARPHAGEALEVIGRELAMLDGLDKLISIETTPSEGLVVMRAPKPPGAVHAYASPTAPRVEALPAVFKLDKLIKSTDFKKFQERVKGEYVRRAASSFRADDAAAPHAASHVWQVEPNPSPTQSPSRTPACDTGADEFTN